MRELHRFEREIVDRFMIGGKALASPKAEWIRGYLLTFGEGYPYGMWKTWKEFAEQIRIKPGTYTSFARYMWILKKLGLIIPSRTEVTKGIPRTYYIIKPGMEDSPIWVRPTQTLYPSTDWTIKPPEVRSALRAKYR